MWQPRRHGWLCRLRLLCVWILAWPALATGAPPSLTLAADLAADGRLARADGQPVVILFSRGNCGWCDKARREHINAMAANPASSAVFRQIDIDRDAALTDFSGQRTSHRAFARRQAVKLTPTLMFFADDGRQLAAPIVGYRLPEFYGALIEDAIEDSHNRLRGEGK